MIKFIQLAITLLGLIDTLIKKYTPTSYEKAQKRIDDKRKQIEREHEDGS